MRAGGRRGRGGDESAGGCGNGTSGRLGIVPGTGRHPAIAAMRRWSRARLPESAQHTVAVIFGARRRAVAPTGSGRLRAVAQWCGAQAARSAEMRAGLMTLPGNCAKILIPAVMMTTGGAAGAAGAIAFEPCR
jgi:hypothetical protein